MILAIFDNSWFRTKVPPAAAHRIYDDGRSSSQVSLTILNPSDKNFQLQLFKIRIEKKKKKQQLCCVM